MKTTQTREVFNVFTGQLGLSFDTDSADKLFNELHDSGDFNIDIDGQEFRLIEDEYIRDTAQEEIAATISECYLQTFDGKDLPWWIELDWNKTVQNCIDADGYGHHFSTYDGNEYEAGGWYIFRTN
jgi:hypothetical protein